MPAVERLRPEGDVRAVFAARQRVHGSSMVVHLRRRDDDGTGRATVVAGRKVGRATRRNRAKRRLRAALREIGVPPGCDVVVVARAEALAAPFPSLLAELGQLLGRAAERYGSDAR